MKSGSGDEEDVNNPSWMDEDNDGDHRSEVTPLFGTGKLSLQDKVEEKQDKKSPKNRYGAVEESKDEESQVEKPSVVSTASTNDDSTSNKQQPRTVLLTESGKPDIPRRNYILDAFSFVEWFGVVTSLCLMATQVSATFTIFLWRYFERILKVNFYTSTFRTI
jgi:hypothetical protein